jgi:hypothetical protein
MSDRIDVDPRTADALLRLLEQQHGRPLAIVLITLPAEGGIPSFTTSLSPDQMERIVIGAAKQIRRGGKRVVGGFPSGETH